MNVEKWESSDVHEEAQRIDHEMLWEGVVSSMKVRGSWSSEIQASPIEDAGVKLR